MSLEIVNEDFVITITPNGAWTPGNPTYTMFKATKLKVNTKFALIWHLLWSLANKDCVKAGYTHVIGAGVIMPTGIKCFTNGDNPLRRTDNGLCNGSFTKNSDSSPLACNCTFTITNAGQNKAKAE
jgi:hypothetical protein